MSDKKSRNMRTNQRNNETDVPNGTVIQEEALSQFSEDNSGFRTLLDVVCEQPRVPVNKIKFDQTQHDEEEDSKESIASSVTLSSDDGNNDKDLDEFVNKEEKENDNIREDQNIKRKQITKSQNLVTPSPSINTLDGNLPNESSGMSTFKVLGRRLTFNRTMSAPSTSTTEDNRKGKVSLYSFARCWHMSTLSNVKTQKHLDLNNLIEPLPSSALVSPAKADPDVTHEVPPIKQITLEYKSGSDLLAGISKKSKKSKHSKEALLAALREWSHNSRQEFREKTRWRKEIQVQQETAKNMELLCNESDGL